MRSSTTVALQSSIPSPISTAVVYSRSFTTSDFVNTTVALQSRVPTSGLVIKTVALQSRVSTSGSSQDCRSTVPRSNFRSRYNIRALVYLRSFKVNPRSFVLNCKLTWSSAVNFSSTMFNPVRVSTVSRHGKFCVLAPMHVRMSGKPTAFDFGTTGSLRVLKLT